MKIQQGTYIAQVRQGVECKCINKLRNGQADLEIQGELVIVRFSQRNNEPQPQEVERVELLALSALSIYFPDPSKSPFAPPKSEKTAPKPEPVVEVPKVIEEPVADKRGPGRFKKFAGASTENIGG